MKKRLFSIMLALIMCIGMIPMYYVHADVDPLKPVAAEGFMDALVEGKPIPYEISAPEGADYTVTVEKWEKVATPGSEGSDIELNPGNNNTLTSGRYRLHVLFKLKEGISDGISKENIPIIHAGNETWNYEGGRVVKSGKEIHARGSFYVGDVEHIIHVNNLEATIKSPVAGQKPDCTITIPENVPYTVTISEWSEYYTGIVVQSEELFQKNKEYAAKIKFTLKPGYEFPVFKEDINVKINDENGSTTYTEMDGNSKEISIVAIYDTGNPRVQKLDFKVNLPKPGQTAADFKLPELVHPEDEEKVVLKNLEFKRKGEFVGMRDDEIFEAGKTYSYRFYAYIKSGYRILDVSEGHSFTAVDQYGRQLDIDISTGVDFNKDGTAVDFICIASEFVPADEHFATFHVLNGKWSDGTKEDKYVQLIENNGKLGFSKSSIPTGMTAEPGYVGGEWDLDPYNNCSDLKGNTTYTYTFSDINDKATVTLKIVNGTWKTNNDLSGTEQYHSNDIVIAVPLVNGKGTLPSDSVPNNIIEDNGCLKGEWDVAPDFREKAITKDVTYTYTCPRVVSEPMKYTLNYDVNGGNPETVPEAQIQTVLNAFCPFTVTETVPTREGYNFVSWNTEQDGSGIVPDKNNKITLKYDQPTQTMYAQWEKIKTRTVEFIAPDADSDTVPEVLTLYPDENGEYSFTVPYYPVPLRTGYNFKGYKLVPVMTTKTVQNTDALYQPGDLVVLGSADAYNMVAQWEEKYITLTYDANGGTGAPPAETKRAESSNVSFEISNVVPTYEGYKFAGWLLHNGDLEIMVDEKISIDSDTVLYAKWEKIEKPIPDKPTPDKPDADKPDNSKPDADKPDNSKPDADKPDNNKPEADKPDMENPQTDKPDMDQHVQETESTPSAPKTGDNNLFFPVMIMLASGTMLTIIKRKTR